MSFTEFSFSIDDFNNPKVYKDAEAIMMLLVRLLLLEPGTIQSHPEMGVGLMSKYRFANLEDAVRDIRNDFSKQITTYLPRFQGVKVSTHGKDGYLMITAEIDSTVYGIYYDINTSEVKTDITSLSSLD